MSLVPSCDLFIACGEPSGDAYAAAILQELRRRDPRLVCAAMGGPELKAAGAEIEQEIEGLAVMGLLPVLRRLPELQRAMARVQRSVRMRRPKVVLTLDYPGFNLRLQHALAGLRRQGVRFVHVVAPQVWAWRPRRAKRIALGLDRLLCFFPFEPPLFNRFADRGGGRADFVGHPLLDLVPPDLDTSALAREIGLQPDERLLLLAPGSRAREISAMLPVYHQAVELVRPFLPGPVRVVVSRVGEQPIELYRQATHYPLVEGRYRELCRLAHAGLVASGTATLEAALLGLPHVIAYRFDRITAAISRQVLIARHVGLPNLVSGHRLLPEVLQDQFTPDRLAQHLLRLWAGPRRQAVLAGLAEVRSRLGAGGAVGRMADLVAEELAHGRRGDTSGFAPGSVARSRTESLNVPELE